MSRTRQEILNDFLANPQKLLLKKPFLRGTSSVSINDGSDGCDCRTNWRREAHLPNIRKTIISQERFAKELDPASHDVIFDSNLPSICVKVENDGYIEIKFKRFGIPFQKCIVKKKALCLGGNKRQHVLHDSNPSDELKKNFADFKWHWDNTNQDGIEMKAIKTQLSYGDVGLLTYMNENDEVRERIFSYEDGYQIITHKDDNGEPLLDCVYYRTDDNVRHIDAYSDTTHYHFTDFIQQDAETSEVKTGWQLVSNESHGFSESPLATKRGNVAWEGGEDLIELFEIIYNLFAVIQKRHGWGQLYIKGKLNETAKKIAGSVILNDTSIDGKGDAKYLTPPSPQNMIEFLQSILDQLEIATGVTFILPKDVKSSGDISGLAIQMTRSLDIEESYDAAIEWQNFTSKHSRLFKEGLAKQLVASGENPTAITSFAKMNISTSFKPWQPFDESTWNQMLCTLKGSGLISDKTGIEKNTVSAPDEEVRLQKQQELADERAAKQAEQQAAIAAKNNTNNNNNDE